MRNNLYSSNESSTIFDRSPGHLSLLVDMLDLRLVSEKLCSNSVTSGTCLKRGLSHMSKVTVCRSSGSFFGLVRRNFLSISLSFSLKTSNFSISETCGLILEAKDDFELGFLGITSNVFFELLHELSSVLYNFRDIEGNLRYFIADNDR